MPPKPAPKANKKTEQKKQERVIEDKTFGLKNKKGTKQQKFIQQVQHQVKHKNESREKLEAEKHKKQSNDVLKDLDNLIKPVLTAQKTAKDVDPKSVLCAFYKQGMCQKGAKCKFSHDLSIEFKAQKKNLYVDAREQKGGDTMEDWDEATLNDVIAKKHAEKDLLKPKTDIICKYFLEAVEENKYGWFWDCPNGDSCIYKHALPQGYVLKKEKKKMAEEASQIEQISLEELIESERAALNSASCTKVTLETFLAWKKRKVKEKKAKKIAADKKRRADYKAGKDLGLSGRELFTFNPELVGQDDDEADDVTYEEERNEDEPEDQGRDVGELFRVDDGGEISEFAQDGEPVENGTSGVEINEDLFDPDEIPDDLDEDDLTDPDEPGCSKHAVKS